MPPGGITVSESGSIMATGEQGVNTYRMVALRSMLSLEIKTGMKMSRGGSPMKVCKELCGSKKNTKKGVYLDFDAYLVSLGFDSKPLS
jgi:hypothetical protein